MGLICEACGLPILDDETTSLFQTRHHPRIQCIRRLRAENERLRTALQAAYDKLENMHHIEASYIIAAALDCGI